MVTIHSYNNMILLFLRMLLFVVIITIQCAAAADVPTAVNVTAATTTDGVDDDNQPPELVSLVGLFPLGEIQGRERASAAALAVRMINEDKTFLPNVKLSLKVMDTLRSPSHGLRLILQMIREANEDVFPIGIVGASSSSVSMATNTFTPIYGLSMISYASTSAQLSNTFRYPYFARTVPTDTVQARVWAELAQTFYFKRAAVLATDDSYGLSGIEAFREASNRLDIDVVLSVTFGPGHRNVSTACELIEESNAYFIVLITHGRSTIAAVNEINFRGLHGSNPEVISPARLNGRKGVHIGYVWVLSDGAAQNEVIRNFRTNGTVLAGALGVVPYNGEPGAVTFYDEQPTELSKQFYDRWLTFKRNNFGINVYSPFAADSVYLFAFALETFLRRRLVKNVRYLGTQFLLDTNLSKEFRKILYTTKFRGITGNVSMDASGDRPPHYRVLNLIPGDRYFSAVGFYFKGEFKMRIDPIFSHGTTVPPIDPYGLPPELIPTMETWLLTLVLAIMVALVIFASILIWRWWHSRTGKSMEWYIALDALIAENEILPDASQWSRNNLFDISSLSSYMSDHSESSESSSIDCEVGELKTFKKFKRGKSWTTTLIYKGRVVCAKKIQTPFDEVSAKQIDEIQGARCSYSPNVTPFFGLAMDGSIPVMCLSEYLEKGSLLDVLHNSDIDLEWTFRLSLMADATSGLNYLHSIGIIHGRLNSNNMVVSERWTLKITDFWISSLLRIKDRPPIVRVLPSSLSTSSSFSSSRSHNYLVDEDLASGNLKPKSISVAKIEDSGNIFIQSVESLQKALWIAPEVLRKPALMSRETDIYSLGVVLTEVSSRAEPYSEFDETLDAIISQIVYHDLRDDAKNSTTLTELRSDLWSNYEELYPQEHIADRFDDCTCFFSDIVGFTAVSRKSQPEDIVNMLNELFCLMDELCASHGITRIKTVGDAYMCCAGVPLPLSEHAERVAWFSLEVFAHLNGVRTPFGTSLAMRAGTSCGPVVAGLVGTLSLAYDCWGDTVNIASRMESYGTPGRLHASESAYERLKHLFNFEKRDKINVKGQGFMQTYFLNGPKVLENESLLDSSQKDYRDQTQNLQRSQSLIIGSSVGSPYMIGRLSRQSLDAINDESGDHSRHRTLKDFISGSASSLSSVVRSKPINEFKVKDVLPSSNAEEDALTDIPAPPVNPYISHGRNVRISGKSKRRYSLISPRSRGIIEQEKRLSYRNMIASSYADCAVSSRRRSSANDETHRLPESIHSGDDISAYHCDSSASSVATHRGVHFAGNVWIIDDCPAPSLKKERRRHRRHSVGDTIDKSIVLETTNGDSGVLQGPLRSSNPTQSASMRFSILPTSSNIEDEGSDIDIFEMLPV